MTLNFTKTYTTTLLFLFICVQGFALNVTVMESQSFHPAQTMDLNWFNASEALGHTTTMEEYSFLDDSCNLQNTDILIISSGLLNLSETQKDNIEAFVRFGGQLYIQAEYLFTHTGNITFQHLVTELGGTFEWVGQGNGQQTPMLILDPIKEVYNNLNQLNYYWYGTYGEGDNTITGFLQHNGEDFGFVFESNDPVHGKIVCTSDQDWIRNFSNPLLLENIIKYLENQVHTGDLPEITITSSAEESCIGEVVTFNADILNYHPGVALQWMINGQAVSGATDIQFETSDLQDGDVVECVLQLAQLCNMHQHVSNPVLMAVILPIATPTIEISSTKEEYCQGEVASFLAGVSNTNGLNNINYTWFVNGVAQSGTNQMIFNTNDLNDQDVIHCELSYNTPCDGDIILNAEAIEVTIIDVVEPVVLLSASETSICEGTAVTFTLAGNHLGNAPTYQWTIDGNILAETSDELTINTLTNGQVVSATVTSSVACATQTQVSADPITITVIPVVEPTAHITADQTSICMGTEARFEVIGSNLGLNPSYEWTVDGAITGTNDPELITTQLTDGAVVNCKVSLIGNCLTTDELNPDPINMQVNDIVTPSVIIDANTAQACAGATITFTATGQNWGLSPVFQWALNGQVISNDATDFVVDNYQENDQITIEVISDELCTIEDTVSATAAPVAISTIDLEVVDLLNEHCDQKNGFVEIAIDGGVAPLTTEWNTGAPESYLENVAAGEYTLVVTDQIGCSATITTEVENIAGPQILDISTTPALCEEATGTALITLNDDQQDYKFHWVFPNGDIVDTDEGNLTLPAGQYDVEVENEFGCIASAIFEVERHSPIVVDLGEDLEVQLGEEIVVQPFVNFSGEMTYEWISEAVLPCNDCEKLNLTPTDNAVYQVVATNEYGCTATDEIEIKVLPNAEVFIPNVFSPNGDGANDYFTVFGGNNLQAIARMQIFDRWGNVIYEETGLTPNVETEGWDGYFKGEPLGQGVYVYVIQLHFIDGKHKVVTGDISIF